jgi:hypothetical protein
LGAAFLVAEWRSHSDARPRVWYDEQATGVVQIGQEPRKSCGRVGDGAPEGTGVL